MRPVNLIPPEERRGEKAPMRTGPLAYVVVAVLAVALLALVVTVLSNNQIADRKSEKANLQSQVDQAQAEAKRLQSFADFASMQQARETTVTSLAESRFDWQRVLRELSIVIPSDVWLTDLTAKVSPEAGTADSSSSSSSSSSSTGTTNIAGPSLDIKGCASGHDAVAEFIAALQDVDGVTRVSVLSSDRPDPSSAGTAGGSSAASADSSSVGGTCSARNFISTFEVIAAFDAVPTAAAGQTAAPTSPTAAPTSVAGDPTASAADKSQVADGEQQLQQQKASAKQQTDKAHKDVHTLIPGTGTAP
jgi:Tfp pilus assembly protein PilN